MRTRTDRLLRLGIPLAAGMTWGWALGRFLAETTYCPPLFDSYLPAALLGALVGIGVVILSHRLPGPPLSHSLLFLPILYLAGAVAAPLAGGVLLVGSALLAFTLALGNRLRWLPPVVLGIGVLATYLFTLLPSVGQADTFEFQVIVPQLGVAHPTGYPLYVLLAKLFTFLPLRNVAWRVNLASAVFATGATLILYTLLARLIPRLSPQSPPGPTAGRITPGALALLAALTFAFSSTFWSQAIIAEVYALHNLLVAALLLILLTPTHPDGPPAAGRWQGIFFLTGLSLTNHLTTALLLPAIGLALFWERPRLRARDWAIAGAALLLGLSVYLFIPLRWPAVNQGEWLSLPAFLRHVTGGQFHGALQLDGWRDPTRWAIVWRLMRDPFGPLGLGLAALGVLGLALRRRRTLAYTGVTFLAFLAYGLNYYVPDLSVFLIPAHLIVALWIGAGIATLFTVASRLRALDPRRPLPNLVRWTTITLCALLPLSRVWINLPAVKTAHKQADVAWGRYVLGLPLAEGSAILADMDKFAPLYYLQQIEGQRTDLDLVVLGSEERYRADLVTRLAAGQTVYLARYLPHLEGLTLESAGPLVEVGGDPAPAPAPSGESRWRFGPAIHLLDAQVSPDPQDRALHHVTLTWRAAAPVNGDYVIRLRLVDDQNEVRWTSTEARPVGGLYPTNAWPPCVTIADYHPVATPPWLPAGEYVLQVGVFPPFGESGLTVDDTHTEWLSLETLDLIPPADPPRLTHRRHFLLGTTWLTGYDLPDGIPAGAPLTIDLGWRNAGQQGGEGALSWRPTGPEATDQETTYFSLPPGARRTRHVVVAPDVPGDYALSVGLTGQSAHCGWGQGRASSCLLTSLRVTPAQEGLANFENQILLLDANVEPLLLSPGDPVHVTVRWRALQAMDEEYTAFVHLVGPDGRLYGQVDAWPVHGSYPTSQWTPGDPVDDPYQVILAPDAPAGVYQVRVGWYLLKTMTRLQTVDEQGHPTADHFPIGEISVLE